MKHFLTWIGIPVALVLGIFAFRGAVRGKAPDVEYRYAPVQTGEVVRSISATGQLIALTKVEIKSKAGGNVVRLAVDEGDFVKAGDLIAIIDPADTQALYDQASADLSSSDARAQGAEANYELQITATDNAIRDAQAQLEASKIRAEKARIAAERQPQLSGSGVQTAQTNLAAAQEALRKLQTVTLPQTRQDASGTLDRTRAELEAARADLGRHEELLKKGFVSQSQLDQARARFETADSAYKNAEQRMRTLEDELSTTLKAQRLEVERTEAALVAAKANISQDSIARQELSEARNAVRLAEIALKRAQDQKKSIVASRSEMKAAKAATVRNQVALKNAKVQLDSTTVLAPRDGVVTQKFLEEGTIIPPGTSTFSQGPSIVEISDVSQMFVDCNVDEADIGQVKEGQTVRIVCEAFPGRPFPGVVERIHPAAATADSVTTVKVRVKVLPGVKQRILPGMNTTCEFITLERPDVLKVPSQAIQREDGKTYVRIRTSDPAKPERREVQVGETGNDSTEILSGLKEGEEIVIAELNLKELREIDRKMKESEQGGGLAGGGGGGGRRR